MAISLSRLTVIHHIGAGNLRDSQELVMYLHLDIPLSTNNHEIYIFLQANIFSFVIG